MNDAPGGGPPGERGGGILVWLGGAAAVVVIAVLVTLAASFLLGDGGDGAGDADGAPELRARTTVRDAPSTAARVLGQLDAGTPVRLVGRSADATWLVIEAAAGGAGSGGGQPTVGWVPRAAVTGGDLEALPLVEDGSTASTPTPTADRAETEPNPDAPDLVLVRATSQDNVLTVTVANRGSADIGGPVEVAVAGGNTHRVDIGGKPLRPGDEVTVELPGEYVQLRAFVTLTVRGPDGSDEAEENNELSLVVAPDRANDLEIVDASPGDGTGMVVRVRNNSPIPLTGTVTIVVRDDRGAGPRLARETLPLDLAAQDVAAYTLDTLPQVDLTRAQVLLSTEAIADANSSNDVYPR